MCVLGSQASHLLLIRTNFGYGTVLTAACAHQGCSLVWFLDLKETWCQDEEWILGLQTGTNGGLF
jgi:hypothetical protein